MGKTDKHDKMSILYYNIPLAMKQYSNWICWAMETRNGRKTKIPKNPRTGRNAKANDAKTWATFEEAQANADKFDGIGFEFSGTPFVGIDLDHCLTDGKLSDQASQIVEMFESYTELSPSGTGLHIICRVQDTLDFHKAGKAGRNFGGIEIYQGSHFFTVTGRVFENRGTLSEVDKFEAVQKLINKLAQEADAAKEAKQPTKAPAKTDMPAKDITAYPQDEGNGGYYADDLDDETLIQRASKTEKFSKLFVRGDRSGYKLKENGDIDPTRSDFALFDLLIWWCGKRKERVISLFLRSALATDIEERKKGHVADYLSLTYDEAEKNYAGVYYDPRAMKKKKIDNAKASYDADRDILKNPHFRATYVDGHGNVKLYQHAIENYAYLCDGLGFHFRLNEFINEIEIHRHGKFLENLDDAAAVRFRGIFEKNGLKVSKGDTWDTIACLAANDAYSPVRDWLNACRKSWDGKDRIAAFFDGKEYDPNAAFSWDDTIGDDAPPVFQLDENAKQYREFLKKLFTKWLISAARLAFNTGDDAAQGMLILRGPQGIGKTRFLQKLVPNIEWAGTLEALDPGNKDDKAAAFKRWMIEVGEFGGSMRLENINRLKAFITQNRDDFRAPYERKSQAHPRHTVFVGTLNDDKFLKDRTGDRRYWTIAVDNINLNSLPDVDMLWGQIMRLAFDERYPHWLDAEEIKKLLIMNRGYKMFTNEQQILVDKLDWDSPVETWDWYTATEIVSSLDMRNIQPARIAKALRGLKEIFPDIEVPTNHHKKTYKIPKINSYNPLA